MGQDNGTTTKVDMVNHPPHYTFGKYEVIDVIEEWGLNFELANCVKYIARAGKKIDLVEDMRKAQWYLQRYIYWLDKGPKSFTRRLEWRFEWVKLFLCEALGASPYASRKSNFYITKILEDWNLDEEFSSVIYRIFWMDYKLADIELSRIINKT